MRPIQLFASSRRSASEQLKRDVQRGRFPYLAALLAALSALNVTATVLTLMR